MPLLRITAQVDALVAFSRSTAGVSERAADLTPVFAAGVDPLFTREITAQFDTEGAHFGEPWAALEPSTLRKRARSGHGRGGILRDTDVLYDAFTNPFDSGAIRVVEPQFYARGVSVPYYPFLHEGTSRMVERPVVPPEIPPGLGEQIYALLQDYILTGAVGAGGVA